MRAVLGKKSDPNAPIARLMKDPHFRLHLSLQLESQIWQVLQVTDDIVKLLVSRVFDPTTSVADSCRSSQQTSTERDTTPEVHSLTIIYI